MWPGPARPGPAFLPGVAGPAKRGRKRSTRCLSPLGRGLGTRARGHCDGGTGRPARAALPWAGSGRRERGEEESYEAETGRRAHPSTSWHGSARPWCASTPWHGSACPVPLGPVAPCALRAPLRAPNVLAPLSLLPPGTPQPLRFQACLMFSTVRPPWRSRQTTEARADTARQSKQ